MESVSLRFYDGGGFKKSKNGLLYVGGQIKTVEVDPDWLCGFWLKELAGKCGSEREIEQVMYLVPGLLFEDGLRTVFDDKEVMKLLGRGYHSLHIHLPMFHHYLKSTGQKKLTPKRAPTGATRRCPRQIDSPAQKEPATGQSTLTLNDALNVEPINPNISTQPPSLNNDNDKLNPSFIRTSVPDDYQWKDIRPDSPLGWADLLRTDFSSDVDEKGFLSDEGVLSDELSQDEDEEQQIGEEIVGEEQLEQEAGEGRLGLEQQQKVVALSGQLDAGEQGPLEFEQSREERSLLVSENSDWASFKWRARQRFPTRELFKKAIAKFAIIQGRNLGIVVSNKKRNQRIGMKCIGDCPFRLYSSWDSRRASFVVKTVMNEHTCCRNMVKNKQLKSTWCAEQLLEVFKAKPHWPAKDIIETIRRAYKVVVKKDFAYRIKHYAHRMLHGSMKDHYKKVGRYLQALKDSISGTHLELVSTIQNDLPPLVNKAATEAFQAYNPKVFYRAHMSATTKADVITNNMAETFNAYIIQARSKHLLYMLEDIRASLMQRLVEKRKEMEKDTAKLEKEKDEACKCQLLPSSNNLFQVNHYLDSLTVNLSERSCTCRKWDMTGVPCCHGVACIFFSHLQPKDFVDPFYTKEVYLKAYSGSIPPLEGERHWPRVDMPLDTPSIKIGPGRPRKKRKKDPFDDPKKKGKLSRHGMEMTCSLCKLKGHNKRKCPNTGGSCPNQPPAKKTRGRPRKAGATIAHNSDTTTVHHAATAEPTRIGRGGRIIRGRRGSRGGRSGREGRGGRSAMPVGICVLVEANGSAYT
ncbi:Sulfate adenylyltransferase subunit 1, partial [Bienertia sinuspersici]